MPYNPQGNGQCKRYNGLIWKTIQFAVANHGCSVDLWGSHLHEGLYAIRMLLYTATNMRSLLFPVTKFYGYFLPIMAFTKASMIPFWTKKS